MLYLLESFLIAFTRHNTRKVEKQEIPYVYVLVVRFHCIKKANFTRLHNTKSATKNWRNLKAFFWRRVQSP